MNNQTEPEPSRADLGQTASDPEIEVPRRGETDVFALSFGPGAFDTMVQLGVIHALLVSRRRPPNVVLGLSAGAANAVALGEVFSESSSLDGQVGRFREILNAARGSLRVFKHELSPDPLELNTEEALAPMELPIHHEKERRERKMALRSVIGILRLFNDVTRQHITVHVLVQLTRRCLRIREALAFRNPSRYRKEVAFSFLHLAAFALPYQWRFVVPTLRAMKRIIFLPPKEERDENWNIKPLDHFLSIWHRFVSLGFANISAILALIPAGYLLTYVVMPMMPQLSQRLSQLTSTEVLTTVLLFILAIPILLLLWGTWLVIKGPSKSLRRTHWSWPKAMLLRLLEAYDLHDQISNSYVLKQFLVSTFDPHYYGKFNRQDAVAKALGQADTPGDHKISDPKTLDRYLKPKSPFPIRVAIVGTQLSNGKSIVLPKSTGIIDAILASMAYPPFFKPVPLELDEVTLKHLKPKIQFIDPACVGEEPIAPLMEYLRKHADPTTKSAYVFHVTPFPAQEPVEQQDSFTSLTTIGIRSLDLLRSRHVSLEQRLTTQYSKLLPADKAIHPIENTKFVGATLFPIDTEYPLGVTERFLTALSNEERERTVLHAVATGCRIALQRILAPESQTLGFSSIQSSGEAAKDEKLVTYIKCRNLVAELGLRPEDFPGSDLTNGPGLREVCDHCTLLPLGDIDKADATQRQVLRLITIEPNNTQPLWPTLAPFKNHQATPSPVQKQGEEEEKKKQSVPANTGVIQNRPWITSVWSGGVFRGVFQVGAINGYNEANVKPRIFAGTSVGSIMAAFAARVSSLSEKDSKIAIQKVAATFIGLDRLIVTDRFADFIRRLTIRANDVHVTPKILDQVFRQFDVLSSDRFNKNVRLVAAGFERLFYMSPFELLDLTRALHNTDGPGAVKMLLESVDYFFQRSGAGLELLGSEPLCMLITEHVLESVSTEMQETLTIGDFLARLPWLDGRKDRSDNPQKFLLISATDLTNGTPEVIGSEILESGDRFTSHNQRLRAIQKGSHALLIEALLAGSAFPGVFRPRRRSEVDPMAQKRSIFVDGGIMDNLPLDAVVHFMKNASETGAGLLRRRPSNPHLILTASLERRVNDIPLDDEKLGSFDRDWRALTQRVTELQYNRKVMVFTKAQRHFRFIHDHARRNDINPPLNYVVGTVKPEWLCDTFAFHPMLGFSQVKQAGSIAHGCAMTLATLSLLAERPDADQWGIQMGPIELQGFCNAPKVEMEDDDFLDEKVPPDRIVSTEYLSTLCPDQRRGKTEHGHCWFRRGTVCPFSSQGLQKWDGQFPEATRNALTMIYDLCGQASTHTRQDA